MNFETFFKTISYSAVICGFASLWVTGTFGVVESAAFVAVVVAAWFLEGSRWQVTEWMGTALIVLALPAFYLVWRFQLVSFSSTEAAIAGILARMILSLTSIKLLQKKSGRDWIFLYLMSFFEVLLAAGLSISAVYLASFLVYLLVMVCAIIAFEIRKTSIYVSERILPEADPAAAERRPLPKIRLPRLPAAALALLLSIVVLAVPLFFTLPRVGGAGLGGERGGLSTSSGFSDTVRLGGIGRIQQNDAVVMRVKMEGDAVEPGELYFRGIALDKFDNQSWSVSPGGGKEPHIKGERELIQFDYASGRESLTVQTIFLEPLDTPILFALPRVVAIQGNFPVLYRDNNGAISFQRSDERISYKVLSDRSRPAVERLRTDKTGYPLEMAQYLALPKSLDPRITELASTVAANSANRYDKAAAIEKYLQTAFGYTLEQKAGGNEPLSDFLFNVREGHCEYFATAMAVMLRTQGIATRIVNGFHGGDYNDAADVTVVRQRNAHAWVEVYFPKDAAWVKFDPTPFAGQTAGSGGEGFLGSITKYIEAIETYWIQYFVAYDNQGQASLARTFRRGFYEYQSTTSDLLTQIQAELAEWWSTVRGDQGAGASLQSIGNAAGYAAAALVILLLSVFGYRRARRSTIWARLWSRIFRKRRESMVEFYARMQDILAARGLNREAYQTPFEFAAATGLPEAVNITEKYNRVRFGDRVLSDSEADEVETWLERLEASDRR